MADSLTDAEMQSMLATEAIGGDESFFLQVLDMICKSLSEKLNELSNLDPTNNSDPVWRIAHTIKGTALQCGLRNLGIAAENLERACRNPQGNDVNQRPVYFENLVRESRRVLSTRDRLKSN
mmetsp:Transcript_6684/g.7667  ORF Transcript_6684/g.7667 Transcript_6684/m.7667 type:complete len:122 (-) Transcript_6684:1267-1632(-)